MDEKNTNGDNESEFHFMTLREAEEYRQILAKIFKARSTSAMKSGSGGADVNLVRANNAQGCAQIMQEIIELEDYARKHLLPKNDKM